MKRFGMRKQTVVFLLLAALLLCALFLVSCGKNESGTHTVTFVSNGGSAVESQTVKHGETAIKPADPTRDGYLFTGWLLGDEAYDFGRAVENDLTLTASWSEIRSVSVTFMGYLDEEHPHAVLDTQTVLVGESATAPSVPARPGYVFDGWDRSFDCVTGPITVEAKYARLYTVIFKAGDTTLKTEYVKSGSAATAPTEVPAPVHHTFTGWDKDFSEITADTVVNAQYREDTKHTVTFKGYNGEVLDTQSVYDGEAATAPTTVPVPDPAHIRFVRWDKDFSNVTSDLTVNAVFEEDAKYTVTVSGGSASVTDALAGTTVTLTAAPPAGKVFVRWTVTAGGVTLADATSSTTTFVMPEGNVEVTAEFMNVWTVTFVVNGNTVKTETVREGESATAPTDEEIADYLPAHVESFTWNKSFTNIRSDLTVTAVFVFENQHTVTFKGYNGEVLDTQAVYDGEAATAPTTVPVPDPAHIRFVRWDKDFTNVTSNLTVNAVFEEDTKYTVTFKGYNGEVLDTQSI
ncbi:MAG: InlB B-repeat-containing protein, partial [Eubacteriales bacterium]